MKPLIKSDCKKIIQKLCSIIRVSHLLRLVFLKLCYQTYRVQSKASCCKHSGLRRGITIFPWQYELRFRLQYVD